MVKMTERNENRTDFGEIVEIIAAQPLSEASVSEIAGVVPGNVVASPQQTERQFELERAVECMLFVSTEPLSLAQLSEALQVDEKIVEEALDSLDKRLESSSGLQLMRVAGGYQLCTRPEYAECCAAILHPARKKLSKAALETLAVIAYRQPCTQPEIEAVRGVSVDGVIKTLLDRGLIKEAGRKQSPGRPILYATTDEFLQYFGLNDISELPDIDSLASDESKALQIKREVLSEAERRQQNCDSREDSIGTNSDIEK
jgi:segregation and condensation protein B